MRMCGRRFRRAIRAAMEGATVIVNCSASDETIGERQLQTGILSKDSQRELIAGYNLCKCRRRGIHDGSCIWRTQSDRRKRQYPGRVKSDLKIRSFIQNWISKGLSVSVGKTRHLRWKKRKCCQRISFPLDVCETKTDKRVSEKSRFVPQDEKRTCSAMRRDF